MFSQLESNLNSVERVDYYAKLPAERWEGVSKPAAWPAAGRITFDDLELRYRPDLPPVVRGLSLEILPGEKVGIVGRTGSGKSTLLLGLYRILEPSGGRILIDAVDTSALALADLRSSLAIIPQEPVLFRGTVRKNLDPFGELSDEALWSALDKAESRALVERLPGGLGGVVHDGGLNFSVGQRQLLCLARAVLKGSRVLLMDEATASVDVATDALIQKTVRETFRDATVLTIAHRLTTVMDADRVMVLEAGRVVEFDDPARLARQRSSSFAALLREEHQPA
jgi:ABC-type multidrug transport system fused ATPase/permease subunit